MDRFSSIQNIWIILLIWSLIYLSDYLLTIYSARNIKGSLSNHFEFERSFELNPIFEDDVNNLRLISPRHILLLVITSGFLLFAWQIAALFNLPQLFYFILGELMLLEIAIIHRHLRNIALIKSYSTGAITGHVKQTYWFSLKQSAWEMMVFSFIYLLFALVENSWFFAGGAAGCLILSLRNHSRSNTSRKKLAADQSAPEG